MSGEATSPSRPLIARGWVQAAGLVMLIGLAVLVYLAIRIYSAAPPIPEQVVGEDASMFKSLSKDEIISLFS